MRRTLVLALLAGCATADLTPRPADVTLGSDTMTLRLTDGTLCRANWRAEPTGRLEECGPGFGYAVRVDDRPNLLRQLFEGIDLALGDSSILAPMAEVVITDPAGIDSVFVSPPEVNAFD
jgi:hypothetical protein